MLVREVLEIGSAVCGPPTPDEALKLSTLDSFFSQKTLSHATDGSWQGGMPAAVHVLCRVRGRPSM